MKVPIILMRFFIAMKMSLNSDDFRQLLDKCYEKALNGIPGVSEPIEKLANSYRGKGTLKEQIDEMCDYQIYKCTTSGFLTGLGGLITLPVTIPTNISSVLYVQTRMIAAVAYMCGFDIKDDKVRALVYVCLCGNSAADILKKAGINVAKKLTEKLIEKIPGELIKAINKAVCINLVTKFGSKGLINLGKLVPVVGGVVGGAFDYASTKTIAYVAKKVFYEKQLKE